MPDMTPQAPAPMPPTNKTKTIAAPGQRKKLMMITGGILVLLVAIAGGIFAFSGDDTTEPNASPTAAATPTPTPTPTTAASLLNGEMVANELATRHPLAIMIENHPDSRPQSGLGDAAIVYEAITEGGITRFMGMYGAVLPPKAGPVRSARQVYVDFTKEYTPKSAYYAHVGGSAIALGMIKTDGILDLNQSSIGTKAFERIPKAGIATEHTMYTYPEKLYNVAKSLNYPAESTFTPWKFKADADLAARPEAQSVTIPFSSASYDVKFTYDKATNSYKRTMAGAAHVDANNGKQITSKNVVVQFVNYAPVQSATKIVQDVSVVGEGTAKIFIDGRAIDAKWKRGSGNSRTIYTDATTGKEIEFNRGQIWISLPGDTPLHRCSKDTKTMHVRFFLAAESPANQAHFAAHPEKVQSLHLQKGPKGVYQIMSEYQHEIPYALEGIELSMITLEDTLDGGGLPAEGIYRRSGMRASMEHFFTEHEQWQGKLVIEAEGNDLARLNRFYADIRRKRCKPKIAWK